MKSQISRIENGIAIVIATFDTFAQARKLAGEMNEGALGAEEREIGGKDMGYFSMLDAIEHAQNNPRVVFVAEAAK
jgi:hypothetical protein